MKVPFSWLKEFVDIDVTAQELEEKLFSCGFEVEELIPLDAGISKVVVGKIVEMEKQEGTHLTKCVVDCGDYGHDIRISTRAANMKLGDCVPTALDGSTLPGGITIKARKMQGVESNGMLCSGAELGLNDDLFPGSEVYGLLILPEDYSADRTYPLVLFLHGAGARGTDNEKQLAEAGVFQKILDRQDVDYDCIMVAPQIGTDSQWVNTPWADGSYDLSETPESASMQAVGA